MKDAPYRGSAMKRGGRAKAEALMWRTGYEGSPADVAEDRRGARALGVSLGAYERTARDRREDTAAGKRKRRDVGGSVTEGGREDYDPTAKSVPEVVDDAVGPTAKQVREGTVNPRTGKPWPKVSPVSGKPYSKGGGVSGNNR